MIGRFAGALRRVTFARLFTAPADFAVYHDAQAATIITPSGAGISLPRDAE